MMRLIHASGDSIGSILMQLHSATGQAFGFSASLAPRCLTP